LGGCAGAGANLSPGEFFFIFAAFFSLVLKRNLVIFFNETLLFSYTKAAYFEKKRKEKKNW